MSERAYKAERHRLIMRLGATVKPPYMPIKALEPIPAGALVELTNEPGTYCRNVGAAFESDQPYGWVVKVKA